MDEFKIQLEMVGFPRPMLDRDLNINETEFQSFLNDFETYGKALIMKDILTLMKQAGYQEQVCNGDILDYIKIDMPMFIYEREKQIQEALNIFKNNYSM